MIEGVTLEQLLASREARWQKQREWVNLYPNLTLVCLTVLMPGNVKRNTNSLIVAHAAVQAMNESFYGTTKKIEERDLSTGYEAYLLTTLPIMEAKRITCHIEETHPLGRLFDIDVIDHTVTPVNRESIGMHPRKCLLCDNEARFCMRNHTHTQEELHKCIHQLIDGYVHRL